MSVPVKCIRMSSTYDVVYRIARKPVLPEFGFLRKFEMGLIPDISSEFPPVRMPRMHICLIYDQTFRICSRNELRLTWNRSDARIHRLAKTHIVIAPQ